MQAREMGFGDGAALVVAAGRAMGAVVGAPAGCGSSGGAPAPAVGDASSGAASSTSATVSTGPAPSGSSSTASSGSRPATVVAVTTQGAVVVLDPMDGHVFRTPVSVNAVGDAVQLSPDGGAAPTTLASGVVAADW